MNSMIMQTILWLVAAMILVMMLGRRRKRRTVR
jgi:hypothetical protein